MTARELLRALREAGVSLSLEGGRLRCVAPKGALTPALRGALEQHRDALVRLLSLSAEQEAIPPRNPPLAPFPLSHPQQRLWFLDQLAGAQAAYVMPAAVYIRGALNVEALQTALAYVVGRHMALRTQFGVVDGEPVQWEVPAVDVTLPVVSVEEVPEERRRQEAERQAAEEAARPFDLEKSPLFRTGLLRLSATEHLFFLGLHHLIADGTSLRILLNELLDAYEGLSSGRFLPAPAPEIQYGNFVAWQRARLQSDACAMSLAHWRRTLENVAALNLPTDRPRTAEKNFRGSSEMLHVSAHITERLRGLARERGASLYAVLLTAFQIVLARSSGQADVAVGTAMANRTRREFEGLVGCVANTVVIRSDVSFDHSFVDLLDAVQQHVRDAWTHQELPFEKLVEVMKRREVGRNPIFDVFLALNVPNPPVTRAGVTFEPVFLKTQAAKFELALFCEDTQDGIRGFLEYQSDIFDDDTVRRILRRLVAVLDGIATDPDASVGRLPLLDDAERALLRSHWKESRRPFARNGVVHDLVSARARCAPSAIAVADDRHAISYEELDDQSNRVARGLRRHGARPGVIVGLCVERSVEMLVALLGILKSGAAYVPLDSAFPPDRLRFLIEDSGAASILTSFATPGAEELPALLRAIVPGNVPILLLEDLHGHDADERPGASSNATADDLAYILYTSGSTGRPKGVEVSHRNVVNFMESMAIEPGLRAGAALMAVTTLSFDIALLELLLPLTVGGRTLVASRATAADGEKLKYALVRSGATAMQATPATWRMLLEAGFRPGKNLKVMCGGEALSPALADDLLASGGEVWNLYGPTETTIWSTVARLRPGQAPSLGKAIANTQIYILDRHRQPVPHGIPGEICIGGEGVARGYHGRPDLTAERFLPDPFSSENARIYRTGDVGSMSPDGTIQFLGRSDDQLKVRGFRIEPGEIEAALTTCEGVQQVAVVADRRAAEDVRLVAYVRCEERAFAPDAFRRFLGDRLPAYMVPGLFVRIDQFPLTPNGKIDRGALSARDTSTEAVAASAWVAPRTPTEEKLAAIWRDILRVDRVGAQDSFFDLGGHSLLAARVIARVHESSGVRLPTTLFFARATIEEHARYIEDNLPMSGDRLESVMNWIEGLSDEEAATFLEQYQGKSQGAHS